jgi:hypothetical protein
MRVLYQIVAKILNQKLSESKSFVYSGNKSIHVWWKNFHFEDYLNNLESEIYSSASRREKFERKARIIFYQKLQSQIPHSLDYRSATDPRRVVPIINTINCFTGRITKHLSIEELVNSNAETIRKTSEIPNWYS